MKRMIGLEQELIPASYKRYLQFWYNCHVSENSQGSGTDHQLCTHFPTF